MQAGTNATSALSNVTFIRFSRLALDRFQQVAYPCNSSRDEQHQPHQCKNPIPTHNRNPQSRYQHQSNENSHQVINPRAAPGIRDKSHHGYTVGTILPRGQSSGLLQAPLRRSQSSGMIARMIFDDRLRSHPERGEGSAVPCPVSGPPVQFSRQFLFMHARQAALHSLLCNSSGARIPPGNKGKLRVPHAASEFCGINSYPDLPGRPAQFGPRNSYIGSKYMCTWLDLLRC